MNNLWLTVNRCGDMTDEEDWALWLTCQSNTQSSPLLSSALLLFHQLISGVSSQWKNQTTGNCSATVLFDRSGERHRAKVEVQASGEELLKIDTLTQDEAFYQQCKTNGSVSAQNLPGELNIGLGSCWLRRPMRLYEVRNPLMNF